jgi:hypothetical protein
MGTRYESRLAIAQFFGGTTWQSQTTPDVGPLIDGPLQANGLSAVYPRWAKRLPDSNFFLFPEPARSMGTIMVVHLPRLNERRIALAGNLPGVQQNVGTKQDRMMIELHLYHLAQVDYAEIAEADFEQMIDAVYNQIETDPMLGGAVIGAGETPYGIESTLNPPVVQEKPERIEQYAKISFQADFFFIA